MKFLSFVLILACNKIYSATFTKKDKLPQHSRRYNKDTDGSILNSIDSCVLSKYVKELELYLVRLFFTDLSNMGPLPYLINSDRDTSEIQSEILEIKNLLIAIDEEETNRVIMTIKLQQIIQSLIPFKNIKVGHPEFVANNIASIDEKMAKMLEDQKINCKLQKHEGKIEMLSGTNFNPCLETNVLIIPLFIKFRKPNTYGVLCFLHVQKNRSNTGVGTTLTHLSVEEVQIFLVFLCCLADEELKSPSPLPDCFSEQPVEFFIELGTLMQYLLKNPGEINKDELSRLQNILQNVLRSKNVCLELPKVNCYNRLTKLNIINNDQNLMKKVISRIFSLDEHFSEKQDASFIVIGLTEYFDESICRYYLLVAAKK